MTSARDRRDCDELEIDTVTKCFRPGVRWWCAVIIASCSSQQDAPSPPPPVPTRVVKTTPVIDAAPADADEHHHLTAAEGTIIIAPLSGARDQELAGGIIVHPGDGYRVNTDLQPHLELASPAALVITPPRLAYWDRDRLNVEFAITAHEAGAYEIRGTLHFAVCKLDACFPKDEPLSIALEVR